MIDERILEGVQKISSERKKRKFPLCDQPYSLWDVENICESLVELCLALDKNKTREVINGEGSIQGGDTCRLKWRYPVYISGK